MADKITRFSFACAYCPHRIEAVRPGSPWQDIARPLVVGVAADMAADYAEHLALYHIPEMMRYKLSAVAYADLDDRIINRVN